MPWGVFQEPVASLWFRREGADPKPVARGAALARAARGRPLAMVEARDSLRLFLSSHGHGRRRARAKLEASSTVCRLVGAYFFQAATRSRRGMRRRRTARWRFARVRLLASILPTLTRLRLCVFALCVPAAWTRTCAGARSHRSTALRNPGANKIAFVCCRQQIGTARL